MYFNIHEHGESEEMRRYQMNESPKQKRAGLQGLATTYSPAS